jgi:glucuronokinase
VIIQTKVCARAGLLGNPSDMYGGKVISFIIEDFSAQVRLWESPKLNLAFHPRHDRNVFENLDDLADSVRRHGYYGMHRLMLASCRRFADYAKEKGLRLRASNFTLEYESDIPRQSGLGGSSAMIIAILRALLQFHRVPEKAISPAELAQLALSVETKELGIAAGLQDRVVQVMDGLTYMDFSGKQGRYTRLDSEFLPRFALAYLSAEQLGTLESGQVHSTVRYRWEQGDPQVKRTMQLLASLAVEGKEALRKQDSEKLGRLMNRNFAARRKLFGEDAIGQHNINMVEIAQAAGLPAKLPGSGGAVLILLGAKESLSAELAETYNYHGYKFQPVQVR